MKQIVFDSTLFTSVVWVEASHQGIYTDIVSLPPTQEGYSRHEPAGRSTEMTQNGNTNSSDKWYWIMSHRQSVYHLNGYGTEFERDY